MKNKFKVILSGTLLIAIMAFAISCKETFTEEDALKAQQEIDLAIYVVNGSDAASAPIAGATVTVNQNGVSVTGTTDATGAALFPKVKVGDFVYTVTAANFITSTGSASASSFNFRESQKTVRIALISTSDTDVATIKGTILMEKDVTNLFPEPAASIDVFFTVDLASGDRTFTTKTDANGNYSIKVPVNSYDTYVSIRYADFEADQIIAVNRYDDESSFPVTLPRKETIKTLFSTNTNGAQNVYFYEGDVRSLFAVAEAPPTGGVQAIISSVFTDATGKVTGVSFSNGGNYSGDADGKVNITITSLDGGTGASMVVTLNGNTSVAAAAGTPANVVLVSGSGYPINSDNYTLNKIDYRWPNYTDEVYVSKGQIVIANADFGTGVNRPKNVDN